MVNQDIHGNNYYPVGIILISLIATFAGSLMQTSMSTAIPSLMRSFEINLNTAQQATTWFLLATGAVIPLSAYLASRFPTRSLTIGTYLLLLGGMMICYLSPTGHQFWWLFIVGRVISALAFGIMLPVMQVMITDIFPTKQRPIAMGLSGLVVGLAPALGPTLTGWILSGRHIMLGLTLMDSWRNIFIIPMIIVTLMLIAAIFWMKDVIPNMNKQLDVLSLVLVLVGLMVFLWGLTNVAQWGWLDRRYVIVPLISGGFLVGIFVIRQLCMQNPFLDVRVFKIRGFTISTVAMILVMMAMYGVEMMLPTYLQNVLGLTPFKSGLTVLGGALFMGIMSPVSGFLFNRVGVRRLTFVGFGLLAMGTLPFSFLTIETSVHLIAIIYAIRMVGIALVMMPLTTSAMDAVPNEMATHASAANNAARQIGSSIAVALLSSVTQNTVNANLPNRALKAADPIMYATKELNASMMGFHALFFIGLLFAISGLCFAFFIKPQQSQQTTLLRKAVAK